MRHDTHLTTKSVNWNLPSGQRHSVPIRNGTKQKSGSLILSWRREPAGHVSVLNGNQRAVLEEAYVHLHRIVRHHCIVEYFRLLLWVHQWPSAMRNNER